MNKTKIQKDYDSEPVVYCSKCYSLKIKYEEAIGADCCMDCGCLDTVSSDIATWEALYEHRYGHKFTVKNDDYRNSPYYFMNLEELKTCIYKNPKWKSLIQKLYPHFPMNYSKAESIVLLFDRLVKDNRLDDIKKLLYTNH